MDQLQKIICVGSAFVGKTSLSRRFTLNTFIHSYIPTLGVSWLTKTITMTPEQLNENLSKNVYTDPLTVRLSLWDTGGQEMFTYLRPKYYAGATCAVLVFDITNQSSFDDIEMWVNEVTSKCPDSPIIIVGNKYDLNEARAVSREDVLTYCKLHKFDYIETSALSAYNVDKLFYHASRLSNQHASGVLKFRQSYII